MTVSHGVLVVDDYEPWRRYVRAEVQENSRWRIVGEASDGIEAVRQAQEHRPDLILLDLGLPMLNGLEAARRILANDPSVRILFLTEQRSRDIAEAALSIGARGFMVKTDAGGKLLSAMETIVNGGRFLSAGLGEHIVGTETRHHEAGFYSDETSLLDAYVRVAEAALGAGNALIVLTEDRRHQKLRERLQARGIDVDGAVREGRYLAFDPEAVMSEFMIDGSLDEGRFRTAAAALVAASARASTGKDRRVVACGECAPTLWREGNAEAAVRLEQLWDELAVTGDIDVFCGYSLDVPNLPDDSYAIFQRICAKHSAIHVL